MSPISKFCHKHPKIVTNIKSPASSCPQHLCYIDYVAKSSGVLSREFYLKREQRFYSLGFHARIFSFVPDSGTVDWCPWIQKAVSTNSDEGPLFKGIDIEHLEGWLKVTPPESCRQNFRKNSEFDLSKNHPLLAWNYFVTSFAKMKLASFFFGNYFFVILWQKLWQRKYLNLATSSLTAAERWEQWTTIEPSEGSNGLICSGALCERDCMDGWGPSPTTKVSCRKLEDGTFEWSNPLGK